MKSTAVPLGLLVLGLAVVLLLALTSRLRPSLAYWTIGLYLDTASQRTVGWVMSVGQVGVFSIEGEISASQSHWIDVILIAFIVDSVLSFAYIVFRVIIPASFEQWKTRVQSILLLSTLILLVSLGFTSYVNAIFVLHTICSMVQWELGYISRHMINMGITKSTKMSHTP